MVGLVVARTVPGYPRRKRQVYYMDLEEVVVCHREIALHTAGSHSSYMAGAAYSLMTKIQSDCLVLFPKRHNRPVLECHNSGSRPLLLEAVSRTHYSS